MPPFIPLQLVRRQVAIAGRVVLEVGERTTGQGVVSIVQAIAGARVELSAVPPDFERQLKLKALQYPDWERLSERPDRTHTGADGYFHFINLPDGSYQLTVRCPTGGTRYGSTQHPIQVSRQDGSVKLAIVDIVLPTTALKGRITNADNEPIEMATIRLQGSGETTFSDAEGRYRLFALEAAAPPKNRAITVVVSAPGYASQSQSETLDQAETKVLNVQLSAKTAIRRANGKHPNRS